MKDARAVRHHRLTSVFVALVAAAVAAIGISRGTFAAADTDPYGYLSEADAMASGSLRLDQRSLQGMPWPDADATLSPPGWQPATITGFIVPVYSPGLPLVMAVFQRVAGRTAVFYVVPLLGALAVWMTGRLGTRLYGPVTGAIAAVLLATSPIFVRSVVQPVSDVPAAAWWAASLALAVQGSSVGSLGSGLAASMAILTRPNLVPLAAIVGLFSLWPTGAQSPGSTQSSLLRFCFYAAGAVPGCLVVAAMNHYLNGSALQSGYGSLRELYAWANVGPNLDRYPRWLLQTQTPFIYLGLFAPAHFATTGNRLRWQPTYVHLLRIFSLAVFLSYLFYSAFGREEWVYLRFLLPGFPALLVLSTGFAVEMLRRVTASTPIRLVVLLALCAGLATWQARMAIASGAFATRFSERRYVDVGRYVALGMPRESAFVSGLHAGTIRYYANRLTVRYDLLSPRWLDQAMVALAARGYHPFIALDEGEEAIFRARFAPFSDLGRLDWPPAVERFEPIHVRVYDPADRQRYLDGEAIATGDIGLVGEPLLRQK